jgi:transposase-like protein
LTVLEEVYDMTLTSEHVKRTQKDYSLAFKLQVVDEVEKGELTYKQAQAKYGIQGRSTVLTWLRKHGRLNWSLGFIMNNKNTPQQEIRELKKKIQRLEAEKAILNMAIDVADDKLGTEIRKKYLALSLEIYKRQSKKEKK